MLEVTTPALLFPAISLLMLAYTNRFVTLAGLVRDLKARHDQKPSENLKLQIDNLAFRLNIIQYMQIMGALAFFFCAFSMFSFFIHKETTGTWMFGFGLGSLLISLILLIVELSVSVRALKLMLKNMDK
ncbi:DUF2721 domain-containing protein [Clostridiales bacterium COT073_COT-073]|nr:DUF2721 domain-containing protein [Clostridiales bacterium COT073_COT-073]